MRILTPTGMSAGKVERIVAGFVVIRDSDGDLLAIPLTSVSLVQFDDDEELEAFAAAAWSIA